MTPRILLVEDDLRAAAATQRELARAGFTEVQTVAAHDPWEAAESAIGLYNMWGHDVVVTDGLNAYCARLVDYAMRADFGDRIIIYTGTPDRYEGRFPGVQVVSKPDGAALVAAVRAVLNKKGTKEVQDG